MNPGKRRVYISSTFRDLNEQREALIQFINRRHSLGQDYETDLLMECMVRWRNPLMDALDTCLEEISKADVYILIIGNWYGSIPEGATKSYTEQEFDHAMRTYEPGSKQIYLFHSDDLYDASHPIEIYNRDGRISAAENKRLVEQFKKRSTGGWKVETFSSDEDLRYSVFGALVDDIKAYFIDRFAEGSILKEEGLVHRIDRVETDIKLLDETELLQENNPDRGVFPFIVGSSEDNWPWSYARRVGQDRQIHDFSFQFTSSILNEKLLRTNSFRDLVRLYSRMSRSFEPLFSTIDEYIVEQRKTLFKGIVQFEISRTDIEEIKNDQMTPWLSTIDKFVELFIRQDLINIYNVIIMIHVSTEDPEVVKRIKRLLKQDYGCLDTLKNISYENIVTFIEHDVLRLNEVDDPYNKEELEVFKKALRPEQLAESVPYRKAVREILRIKYDGNKLINRIKQGTVGAAVNPNLM